MTAMRRLNVQISEHQARFVDELIAGGYESVDAVVIDALSRLQADDPLGSPEDDSPDFQTFLAECEETERRIDAGLEPTCPLDEVMARLRNRLEQQQAGQPSAAE